MTDVEVRSRAATPGRRSFVIGAVLLGLLVLAAVLGPLWRHSHTRLDFDRLLGPSTQHPLGTDRLGADVLAQVLRGLRNSLLLGLGVALVVAVVGLGLTLLARQRALRTVVDVLLVLVPVVAVVVAMRGFTVPIDGFELQVQLRSSDWQWLGPILVAAAAPILIRRARPGTWDLVAATATVLTGLVLWAEAWPRYVFRLPEVTLGQLLGYGSEQRYLAQATVLALVLIAVAVGLVLRGLPSLRRGRTD